MTQRNSVDSGGTIVDLGDPIGQELSTRAYELGAEYALPAAGLEAYRRQSDFQLEFFASSSVGNDPEAYWRHLEAIRPHPSLAVWEIITYLIRSLLASKAGRIHFDPGNLPSATDPGESHLLFLCNHLSELDPFLLTYAFATNGHMPPALLASDLVLSQPTRFLYKGSNAWFISSSLPDEPPEYLLALRRYAQFLLHQGLPIGLFPEGTRSFQGGSQPIADGAIGLILGAFLSMRARRHPLVVVPVDLTYDRIVEDEAFVRDRLLWSQFRQGTLSEQELTAWSRRSRADTLRELGLFLVSQAELGDISVSCLSPLTLTPPVGMSSRERRRYGTEQRRNIVRHCDRQWHQVSHIGNTGMLALVICSVSPTWVKRVKLAEVRTAYGFWRELLQREHPQLHLADFEVCLDIVQRTEVVRLGSSTEIEFAREEDFHRLCIYLNKSLPILRFLHEDGFSSGHFPPLQRLLLDNLKSLF